MFSCPKETISGINLNINSRFVARNEPWTYKSEVCSCTKIRDFYMLYINQPYIENQANQLNGIICLLLSLTCLGLLDFGPYYKYHQENLYLFLQSHLNEIVRVSEISFAWDYPEKDINFQIPKLSRLETTLIRHQRLWCVYDKRIYCSDSYKNYRNNLSLMDHPIRMELHLNLKYAARYLELGLLNQNIDGIFTTFRPYIFKSWKRNYNGCLPFLPMDYIQPGKIHHDSLPNKSA